MPARPACLALLLLLGSGCATPLPPEQADAELMFTIRDLVPFGLELGGEDLGRFETRSKTRGFDGSLSIEYEFDAGDERPELPYIFSMAELHASQRGACASFSAGNLGLAIAAETEEHNEIFQYGDETRFAFLVDEGRPLGMVFKMCRSRTAYLLMLGGFYFDDSELFRSAIMPTLEALRALEEAH